MAITQDELSNACNALKATDQQIKEVEEHLSALKASRKLLSEETIPSIMQEMGFKKIELCNGDSVSYKEDISASIGKDRMPAATQWLEEHGFGDLIKTSVVVSFPRLQLQEAIKLANQLISAGYDASLEESVHTMTLKAWIKEQLAAGNDVPLDLFGAQLFTKTTLKSAKNN